MSLAPKELQAIRRRLTIAQQHNKKELKDKFQRALRLFTGDHYDDSNTRADRARVVVNYCLHVEETKVHSVAFRFPEFNVKAGNQEAQGREDLTRAALACSWRHGDIQAEMKMGWKDREIYGTGIVYTGWLFTTDDGARMEDGRKTTDQDLMQATSAGDGMQEGAVSQPAFGIEGIPPDTTPNPSDKWGGVPAATVRDDRFLAKRIYPGNFFVSPECGVKIQEADYCGYVEVRSLDEVKANSRFRNTRQLKGSTNNLRQWFDDQMVRDYCNDDAETADKVPADVKRVKLSHYFEKARRLHVVMCDEHDKPLLEEAWSWEHDRYPFRVRQNVGDTDQFWGIPGPLLMEHQQRELNEARSQLSDHRRRFLPKYTAKEGTISQKAQNALKSADAGEVVFHTSGDEQPLQLVPMPNVQPEVYSTETQVLADIQTIMGVSQYEVGQAPSKRITGAEVEAIQGRGGARAQNDQQEFETWCAEVAKDCLAWLKMYSVKTRQIAVYDLEGQFQQWKDFNRDEIRGEYDIEVYVSSTAPPSNAENIQAIAFLVQSLNPLVQLAVPAQQMGMNLMPLIRQLLKSIPDIRNVDQILPPVAPMGPQAGLMGAPPQLPGAGGEMGGMAPEGVLPGQVPFSPVDDRKLPPDLMALLQNAGGGF